MIFLLELYFKAIDQKSKASAREKTKKQDVIKDRGFKKSVETSTESKNNGKSKDDDSNMDLKNQNDSKSVSYGESDEHASNDNKHDLDEKAHDTNAAKIIKKGKKRKHTEKDSEQDDIEIKKKKKKKKKKVGEEEKNSKKTGSKQTGIISMVKIKKRKKTKVLNTSLPALQSFGLGVSSW